MGDHRVQQRRASPPWATDYDNPSNGHANTELGITDSLQELLGQHGLQGTMKPGGAQMPQQPAPNGRGAGGSSSSTNPVYGGRGAGAAVGHGAAAPAPAAAPGAAAASPQLLAGRPGPAPGQGGSNLSPAPPPWAQSQTTPKKQDQGGLYGRARGPSSVPPASRYGQCPHGRCAVCVSLASDPNEQFRPYMEDGHRIVDPLYSTHDETWGLYAVFDGHGGRDETAYCEGKMHEVVLAELRHLPHGKDVKDALVAAFKKIDSQLAMTGAWNSGCTATVALVSRPNGANGRSRLYVANVGDSRAVLVSAAGARRVSKDHRASDPSEAKRVTEEGGLVRHGRVSGQLSVSRSLGDHHLKSSGVSCIPDVFSCELPPMEHVLVIASDGLWDALDDEGAGELVQNCIASCSTNPKGVCEGLQATCAAGLVNHAKNGGSRDNILALVVFL